MRKDQHPAHYESMARIFHLLGHPVRLCIVCGLIEAPRKNVGEIQACVGIPRSTLSQHLLMLKEVGIVSCEVKHRERLYCVVDPEVIALIRDLQKEGKL